MVHAKATRSIALVILFLTCTLARADEPLVRTDEPTFNRDVRPILSNHCFTCHGPDSATREAELRLDQRDAAIAASDSGASAIAPGDVEASELIRRITTDDPDERMPPGDAAKSLTTDQVSVLTRWIQQGAEYQTHWSFVKPQPPTVPVVADESWPQNDIDRFVMKRLDAEGLKPAEPASRSTAIRRVAFDLTGLPPTIQEIDRFLVDRSPKAYQRMVDRYLDSSAYGEHMARHWLDLARYADSNGYQYDTEREQWVWRDWVIDAYNRNKPFDEFTIEQLAGDLLPGATPGQRLATGFNRNHSITIEGGIIDEEYRTEYVMDRLVTTGEVWMGLTVGCARCHEHKYDPISQQEFYELYAFFNQVPERGMRGFDPKERIASPLGSNELDELESTLAELKEKQQDLSHVEDQLRPSTERTAKSTSTGWIVLEPLKMSSSGGSTFSKQDDQSVVVGGANPRKDVYEIHARMDLENLTGVRLEALMDPSLPGGGPGRHSNSNFVLSEFELTAVSVTDPSQSKTVKFARATADYSQSGYEIAKAIDGVVKGNNGWAVNGPNRKQPASAIFVADSPFGFEGGTELRFRLRHEAGFATHGIGRPRLSATNDPLDRLMNDDPNKAIQKRIAAIEKRMTDVFPSTMVMKDLTSPRPTHVLNRGQYSEPADRVDPGVPDIFPSMPKDSPANRLGFANWLVAPSHPLTARVAVNRYWQRIFGVGLVKTSEDFGGQGELPSHPELLDWMALEFIRSQWDVKHMQRLILNSATYRQSSHVGRSSYERDPENRMLARGPRLRLDGEEIRDAALVAGGLLVKQLGGKSVYPYQPKGLWMELNNRPGYSKEYQRGSGADLYRRSMYTFWKRTVPSPMLRTLDAPEREFCTIRRSRTNTPLQTLLLLNGPQFVEAARHLGQRMMTEGGGDIDARIQFGFRLVTARTPTAAEQDLFRETLDVDLKRFADDEAGASQLLKVGDSPLSDEINKTELAAYTELARLMLNLSEAITKG